MGSRLLKLHKLAQAVRPRAGILWHLPSIWAFRSHVVAVKRSHMAGPAGQRLLYRLLPCIWLYALPSRSVLLTAAGHPTSSLPRRAGLGGDVSRGGVGLLERHGVRATGRQNGATEPRFRVMFVVMVTGTPAEPSMLVIMVAMVCCLCCHYCSCCCFDCTYYCTVLMVT